MRKIFAVLQSAFIAVQNQMTIVKGRKKNIKTKETNKRD